MAPTPKRRQVPEKRNVRDQQPSGESYYVLGSDLGGETGMGIDLRSVDLKRGSGSIVHADKYSYYVNRLEEIVEMPTGVNIVRGAEALDSNEGLPRDVRRFRTHDAAQAYIDCLDPEELHRLGVQSLSIVQGPSKKVFGAKSVLE